MHLSLHMFIVNACLFAFVLHIVYANYLKCVSVSLCMCVCVFMYPPEVYVAYDSIASLYNMLYL